jgi:hypothetical protein
LYWCPGVIAILRGSALLTLSTPGYMSACGVSAQRGGHVNQRLIYRALRVDHLHEPFSNAARPAPSIAARR